jgi:hypothetical protein
LLLFGRGILDPLVFKLEEVFFEADDWERVIEDDES